MMNRDLDEYSDEPLSSLEIKKARRMLEEHDRAHWLWAFLIKLVVAGGAIATAAVAIQSWLGKYVAWK